jgi:hydroxyacylglutathione hydrolase
MLPLEDNTGDIIGKAQRGLGFTSEVLARKAGVTTAQLRALRAGEFLEEPMRRVARALGLGADALVAIGRGAWYPEQPPPIDGFRMITTPYHSMTVNACLVWDAASRQAVAFDTGADAGPLLEEAAALKLKIELVLITHAHVDHVMALPQLLKATGAKAWVNARDTDEEDFPRDVETFATGQSFVLGNVRIETRLTSGHSAGQTTYVVRGLGRPLAIVGDSLFAGSIGGGLVSFADQVRNDREQILTLPDETVLACGHGPLTTVGQEKAHNPFFAA